MPKRRAASRWLSPSTWQAWRTRAYSSTAFILTLPAVRTGRKIRRRLFTPPPRPDTPAASVRDFLSAAYTAVERGPDPDRDGVVRWRRVDLKALLEARFAVRLHERSVGKVLRRLGFARLSVRPEHPKADEAAQAAFKKASPSWSARRCPSAPAASRSRSGSRCYEGGHHRL